MNIDFGLGTFKTEWVDCASEKEKKGWSFSYVYFLKDLKNIYMLLYSHDIKSFSDIVDCCSRENIESENHKRWNNRNVMELVNALRNFGLVENFKVSKGRIFQANLGEVLTDNDKSIFKNIFFSYFRFKEFLELFEIKEISENGIIVCFMENSRFYNCFARLDRKVVYKINDKRKDQMRFWEVFIKWGLILKTLSRFPFEYVYSENILEHNRSANVVYLVNDMPSNFSILDYILQKKNMTQSFYIPDIEKDIIFLHQYSVDDIKKRIIEECKIRYTQFRMQKSSEVQIEEREKNLLPFFEGAYMSHILKL